jgi:hypothetical protein
MTSDLSTLFELYDQADEAVNKARAELEGTLALRSSYVKMIRDSAQSSGPFNHNGHACKIVQRGKTFFFRTSKMVAVDVTSKTSGQENGR